MNKKRVLWTPDEWAAAARAAVESAFGGSTPNAPVEAPAKEKPSLKPRPVWVPPTQREAGVTISALRKAQRVERKRAKFNRRVKASLAQASRKLTKVQKQQIRAAKAAYRAAVKRQRAQAQAALTRLAKAEAAAETLRKQVEAARQWLRLEALRQRNLDREAMHRIYLRKENGFGILQTGRTEEGGWGASCNLRNPFAKAAAMVWAAEQI